MRKSIVIMLAVVTIIAIPVIAGAMPMTFTDTTYFTSSGTIAPEDYIDHGWGDVNKLNWKGDYVAWAHQFVLMPAAANILTGTLSVYLKDDDKDKWYNPFSWEIGIGYAEDGTWDLGGVDTGDYAYDINVDYLTDGFFQVAIGSLWGDFCIAKSELEITYDPVPEPATIMLLGSGIIGFAALRKRFAKT